VTAFASGDRDIIVRARQPLATVRVRATGEGTVRVRGLPPFVVSGARDPDVPLVPVVRLTGRRGVEEWLYRQRIALEGDVAVRVVPD
jgi:hypothetical protein